VRQRKPPFSRRAVLPFQSRALTPEEAGGEDRVVEFVAATEEVATDGLILLAKGWVLDRFLRAGALLWAHNRFEDKPPLGVPVSAEVDEEAGELRARVRFATAEDHPFADFVYRLVKAGIQRAVSVGFKVLEMRDPIPSEKERGAWGVSTKHELIELSAVPVGADSGAVALVRQAAAAGTLRREDAEAMRQLGGGEGSLRASWEALAKALQDVTVTKRADEQPDDEDEAPKAGASENAAAIKDIAGTFRQGADMLDAIADDLGADEGEDGEDEEEASEEGSEGSKGSKGSKGATAEQVRQAVEVALKPLAERMAKVEAHLAAQAEAAAQSRSQQDVVRRLHAAVTGK
jgi:HK97 family phage prohead protease